MTDEPNRTLRVWANKTEYEDIPNVSTLFVEGPIAFLAIYCGEANFMRGADIFIKEWVRVEYVEDLEQ